MQYFKHSELADTYHVSLKTVHNWIDAAKQGKMALQLYQVASRTYVANTPENILVLDGLAAKGKKYKNSLYRKIVHPKLEFYELYSRRQILDIISNLKLYSEVPRQYNYFGQGASNWSHQVQRQERERTRNMLQGTVEAIRTNMSSIDMHLGEHTKVNVIDIGVGNGRPVKELLEHMLERGVLHRYIAIDISEKMLQVAEQNIKEWFGDKVKFEGYIRDISYERFDDLIVDDVLSDQANKTANLVLFLGATLINFRSFSDTLGVIKNSMGEDDILIYTDGRDTEATRRHMAFLPEVQSNGLSPSHSLILDLLGIDSSLYTGEMGFDAQKRMRYARARLKTAVTIKFSFPDGQRDVDIEKGTAILLWRVWHLVSLEIITEFEKTGFTLLQSSLTKDRQFFLSISGIEAKSE